jgi:hypothetical protein
MVKPLVGVQDPRLPINILESIAFLVLVGRVELASQLWSTLRGCQQLCSVSSMQSLSSRLPGAYQIQPNNNTSSSQVSAQSATFFGLTLINFMLVETMPLLLTILMHWKIFVAAID